MVINSRDVAFGLGKLSVKVSKHKFPRGKVWDERLSIVQGERGENQHQDGLSQDDDEYVVRESDITDMH